MPLLFLVLAGRQGLVRWLVIQRMQPEHLERLRAVAPIVQDDDWMTTVAADRRAGADGEDAEQNFGCMR